jgi:hypothetical protein
MTYVNRIILMRNLIPSLLFLLVCASDLRATAGDYLILDLAGPDDPYHAAAERLAALHDGEIVTGDPRRLAPILDVLKQNPPRYVAIVVRPADLDINLARTFLKIATQVDRDPFIDFAYGFITGDTPEVAVALAEAGSKIEKERRKPSLAVAAVGTKELTKSGIRSERFPLRKSTLPELWGQIAGGENFAEGRDAKFIKTLMPQLQNKSLVMLAGHGYPGEIVGGPTWQDFSGLNLDGAVVMNIACYTGVTGRWFEEDQDAGVRRERSVPAGQSVCLAVLRTGPAAYVGYACPRPAGPELFMDVTALATEGLSVGDVRRRDYNRVVLAHLAQGFIGLRPQVYTDGDPLRPPQNIVKDLLLDMATGGMLFGDPAFRPFEAQTDETPIEVKSERAGERMTVTVAVGSEHLFLQCSESLATWGEEQQPAMRILARVPLGQDQVAEVKVRELKVGGEIKTRRLVWAVEEDGGERFLHIKVWFPQPAPAKLAFLQAGAHAVFEVTTTNDPDQALTRFVDSE